MNSNGAGHFPASTKNHRHNYDHRHNRRKQPETGPLPENRTSGLLNDQQSQLDRVRIQSPSAQLARLDNNNPTKSLNGYNHSTRSPIGNLANNARKLLEGSLIATAQALLASATFNAAATGSSRSSDTVGESSSYEADEEFLFKGQPGSNFDINQQRASNLGERTAAIDSNKQQDKLFQDTLTSATTPTSQNGQTFSDWWSEYWSRQPFPSGYTTSSITILACFITTIIFLIVVGNLLVCIAIFTEKSLKPTQNWFIASLAVSDMLLGLVVMPFSLARELMGFWMFGPLWCDIHEAMDVLLSTASINTLCLISLDRYWSITQAVKYLKKRTPKRGAFMIAFVWFFSAAVSLPPLFGWKKPSPIITVSLNGTSAGAGSKQQQFPNQIKGSTTPASNFWLEPEAEPQSSPNLDTDKRAHRNLPEELAVPFPSPTLGRTITHRKSNNPSWFITSETSSSPRAPSRLIFKRTPGEEPSFLEQEQPPPANPQQAPNSLSATGNLLWSPENAYQTSPTTAEYPSCQLSDDVGYVVYSALGSFFIPCAVMVFTYIKIFKAARSRARRAISKHQTRVAVASSKSRSAKGPAGQPNNKLLSAPTCDLEANSIDHGPTGEESQVELACKPLEPAMTTKGKLVIVDRKKSLASSPALASNEKQPELSKNRRQSDGANSANGSVNTEPDDQKVLAAGGSSCATSNNSSSAITIKRRAASIEGNEEDDRKAAALLKAISQASCLQTACERDDCWADLIASAEEEEAGPKVASDEANLEAGGCSISNNNQAAMSEGPNSNKIESEGEEVLRMELPGAGLNTTNETCFMTIEEDSDMFDGQTGRTIMLIAGNASKKHSLPGRQSQGIVMTMLPANKPERLGEESAQESPASVGGATGNTRSLCQSSSCRAARAGHNLTNNTRSASSYCGSSMTINDDEEEQEDDCGVDDELLTDDCNGYSVSCGLDQYCSNGDNTCTRCQECEHAEIARAGNGRSLTRHLSMTDSPLRLSSKLAGVKQLLTNESEPQSMTGDDNLSLTEYRSNEEDDTSSIMGHGVLDATTPQHKPSGDKKKSLANITSGLISYSPGDAKRKSIGFRLTRLGSSAPAPAGNLLALASSQQQQAASGGGGSGSGGRNLKALRQNFFLKLNQLTAKSTSAKQPEGASKTKKSSKSSPTGKSSAPSSGTSYEQSVDCATTSNVHSEYPHDEITACDESEMHTGTSANLKLQSSTTSASHQDGQRNRKGPVESEANRANDDKALLLLNTPANQSSGGRANLLLQEERNFQSGAQSVALVENSLPERSPNKTGSGRSNAGTGGTSIAVANKAYLASDNERHKRKLAKARERRAILILGIIMAAFICSWLPFFTFYVIRALCNVCRDYVPPRLEAFIFWAGYCNSAINPIIYTIFNRDFRKAFRKLLLCKR